MSLKVRVDELVGIAKKVKSCMVNYKKLDEEKKASLVLRFDNYYTSIRRLYAEAKRLNENESMQSLDAILVYLGNVNIPDTKHPESEKVTETKISDKYIRRRPKP